MAEFNNTKDLLKAMQAQIDKNMQDHMLNVIKIIETDVIESVVYDSYDPKEYERRRANGGLSDTDNIICIPMGSGLYRYVNTTKAKDYDVDLVNIIESNYPENAEYYDSNGTNQPYGNERAFQQITVNELQKDFVNIFKGGMPK